MCEDVCCVITISFVLLVEYGGRIAPVTEILCVLYLSQCSIFERGNESEWAKAVGTCAVHVHKTTGSLHAVR